MKTVILITLIALFSTQVTACSTQLEVDSSTLVSHSTKAIITVDTLQSKPRSQWTMDPQQRAWVAKRAVQFSGTCARGVKQVQLSDGSQTLPATDCKKDGTYQWTYTFSADGTYPLVFAPIWTDAHQVPGSTISQSLVVKTIAPPTPIITTNNGVSFSVQAQNVELQGQAFPDAVAVVSTGASGILTTTSDITHFSYAIQLSQGESKNVSFVAVDFVGNVSDPATINVAYATNVSLLYAQFVAHSDLSVSQSSDQLLTQQASSSEALIYLVPSQDSAFTLTSGLPSLWSLYE